MTHMYLAQDVRHNSNLHSLLYSIDGMVKVRNLKKHMERFNEVVDGLKEGKQEMAKQAQELAACIDALSAKIKASLC